MVVGNKSAGTPINFYLIYAIPLLLQSAAFLFFADFIGLRMDLSPLGFYTQYADIQLLKSDPWGTSFWMTQYAPAWNLLCGLVIHYLPDSQFNIFSALFFIMAMLRSLFMFSVMKALGVGTTLASIVIALHVFDPINALNENLLFYTLPSALSFCAITYFAMSSARDGRAFSYVCLGLSILIASFTRGVVGPGFICVLIAVMGFYRPKNWRIGCVALGIPLAVGIAWTQKNLLITPSVNAVGMNTGLRKITREIPRGRLENYEAYGQISSLYRYGMFPHINQEMQVRFNIPHKKFGHPVVDDPFKSNGDISTNFYGYGYLSKFADADIKFLITHEPSAAWSAWWRVRELVTTSVFDAASTNASNRFAIENYARTFNRFVLGQSEDAGVLWLLAVLFPTAIIVNLLLLIRQSRGFEGMTLAFILATIFYYIAGISCLATSDFPRYRSELDPLLWILSASALTFIWSKVELHASKKLGVQD